MIERIIAGSFGEFLETNGHENPMSPRLPIVMNGVGPEARGSPEDQPVTSI